jgi:hypothetical protein
MENDIHVTSMQDHTDTFEEIEIIDEKKSTGIDLIQEWLLSVRGLTSVITNIEAKQEQLHKDIMELKEKKGTPNKKEKHEIPNREIKQKLTKN